MTLVDNRFCEAAGFGQVKPLPTIKVDILGEAANYTSKKIDSGINDGTKSLKGFMNSINPKAEQILTKNPATSGTSSVSLGKLAPSLVTTEAKTSTAVVDVYKEQINAPQNKLKSILDGYLGSASSILGALVSKGKGEELLSNLLGSYIQTGKLDKAQATAALDKYKNNLLTGVTTTASPLLDGMLGKLGYSGSSQELLAGALGLPGAKNPKELLLSDKNVKLVYDNYQYYTKEADFSSAAGVLKVIENLSKNTALAGAFNLNTEFAILGTIATTAMKYDSPALISKVVNHFDRDEDKRRLILDNIREAAEACSVSYLEVALQHCSAASILAANPDIVSLLVKSFSTADVDDTERAALYTRFVTVIDAVNPNWHKVKRGDSFISDLSIFTEATTDAIKAFMTKEEYRIPIMICGSYGSVDMVDLMQNCFPSAPIDSSAY